MGLNHTGPFIGGFFFLVVNITVLRLPLYLSDKESVCQCRRCRRCGFDPWIRKIPWRRKWQPAPVFLPGESHGQRSLVGYMGSQESDTTEHVHAHYSTARSEDVEACVLRNHRTEKPDVKEYFSQWPKWRDISQSHHHLQNVYDYRPKGKDV